MATTPKRDKVQTVTLTIKTVSLDTIRNRYHFEVEEDDKICQVDKEGNDNFVTSFSKPFSCILSMFTDSIEQIDDIDVETCGNPAAFVGVEKAIYLVLRELKGLKVEISRHFGHKNDIVNGFTLTEDKWLTDTMKVENEDEWKKRMKSEKFETRFAKALDDIARDDDF